MPAPIPARPWFTAPSRGPASARRPHAVSSAKEGIRDRVAAFMKWYGGEGHAAEQEPTPEPQAEVKPEPEGPSYQDNLGIAAGYLQTRTAYQWGASEKDWEKGSLDCSGFTLNTMQKAGYDIQETVRFDPSTALPEEVTPEERDAATKGAYSATVYDFTHMTEEALPELAQARMDAGDREVEEILARYHVEKRGGIDARVGKLPEGPDKARALSLREKARAAKVAKLRELVEAGDPRTMGAVQAMELAEYGQRVELNEVKPGDVVQTWNLYENGRIFGHSTQVFAILCEAILLDEDGKPGKAQPVRIDGDTDPATVYAVPRVVSAELIGAHMAGTDSSGQRHSGGVYVKPPEKLTPKEPPEKLTPEDEGGRFDKVYVGRLSGSRWASWEPGA